MCNNVTDPCQSNQCKNGGICFGDILTCSSTCACPANFTGSNCELSSDPCLKVTCLNGGSCVSNSTKYSSIKLIFKLLENLKRLIY